MTYVRSHSSFASAAALLTTLAANQTTAVARASEPTNRAAADGTLAQEAKLDAILRIALARNPDLAEERERVEAARVRVRQAGRLPEPQLKYEQWGVPLNRPFAVKEANALMLGLAQQLPAPGSLSARARVAEQEASSTSAGAAGRTRDVRAQVRRAFADYYRADRELALHREHVELTARLVELARASYRAGKRAQQDVLRLNLELSRLHRDLSHIEQERISAQALLNALMNRPPEAALGPPAEIPPATSPPARDAASVERGRPEVAAARASLTRSEAALELSQTEARWPNVTLGADYMYMPFMEHPHAYGAMVMLSLPWLSGSRRDAIKAAEHDLAAQRHALESVRTVARYEARDARARFDAASSTFAIVDRDLLPLARRNFETAEAAYGSGQGDAIALLDALRSLLDTRLDRIRSLVHLENAAADLERVLGEKETSR